MELDSLFFRLFYIFFISGHLTARPAVEDGHLFGSYSQGCSGSIDSHVSATDDSDSLAYLYLLPEIDLSQKDHSRKDVRVIFSSNAQFLILMSAHSKKDSSISLLKKVIEGKIRANRRIGFDLYTERLNGLDLFFENLSGEAIGGNACIEHSSYDR